MFQQFWKWSAICLFIALIPLIAGLLWLISDSVLTPGDCKNIGGVICYSHAILIFGWLYSIPAAIFLWLAGAGLKKIHARRIELSSEGQIERAD